VISARITYPCFLGKTSDVLSGVGKDWSRVMRRKSGGVATGKNRLGHLSQAERLIFICISNGQAIPQPEVCGPPCLTRAQSEGLVRKALHIER